MADLRVGIKADVSEARTFSRALKDIKRSADGTSSSLAATTAAATGTSVALSTTVSASGALATTQNLASVANVAVARTLASVAAAATNTAAAETATVTATQRLQAAFVSLAATAKSAFTSIQVGSTRVAAQMKTAAASTIGLGAAGVGVGAALAVGLASGIKSAVEFEKTLSRIEGLVGIAASEVEAFKKPLLEIGKATAKGPNELAEALFFITSAGFKGQEAIDVLAASAKAAAAGLGETKVVADAVTSAVNAYGQANLSASRATDILVSTVREGKAEADSIAGALGQVLPSASELGVKFEELGGVIAALTRIGLGADAGATALGATLAAIQAPGEDAKKVLEEFGTSASELRRKVREEGLLAALQDVNARFGDNEEALTRLVPNVRALRAVLPLVGKNAGDVASIFKSVAAETNATDAAFEAFRKTTSFKLSESLVALQVSLQKIGDELLPAVTLAFVKLAGAVESVVDGMAGLGELVANAISGSADPATQAREQVELLTAAIENYESRVNFITKGALAVGGVDVGLTELSGTYDENLAKLRKQLILWESIVKQNEKEQLQALRTGKALEEVAEVVKEISEIEPAKVIDAELLDKGVKSFKDLQNEVLFLTSELTNLQELGSDGIGLTEDFMLTKEIVEQLQGELGITAAQVRQLVNDKRRLAEAIEDINEAFQKQEAATQFLDDLRKSTADVAEAFAFVRAGGSLIDIEATQQARQILADLGEGTTETLESIKASIIASQAWNDALSAIPVNRVDALKSALISIQELQATQDPESSAFAVMGGQVELLGQALIDAQLQSLGLGTAAEIMFDSLPKAEQFAVRRQEIKDAFNLAGIVDPEQNPEFIAAIEALENKMSGSTDIFKEFAVQAARNVQSAFADFLFDPFSDGLDGLLTSFTETLARMASELLSQQLLKSFFSSLGGSGGGIFQTIAGSFAEGGDVQGGKPILVGEKGPEIITPRQSGTVIPNNMLGGQAAAPQVNVGGPTIVNTIDDGMIVAAFNRGGGSDVVLNNMTENQAAYKNALGIN